MRAESTWMVALSGFIALSIGVGASLAGAPPIPVQSAVQQSAQAGERIDISAPGPHPGSQGVHPNQGGKLDKADIRLSQSVRQGEVLKVQILDSTYFTRNVTPSNGTVSFAGKKVPIFQQKDGSFLALAPVSVFQKPGAYPLTIQDPNGPTVFTANINVQDAHYRTQNVSVSKSTAGLQPEPGELEAVQKLKDALTSARLWEEPFISPTIDCQNSPFGVKRYHNAKATGDYHKGVDLRSPAGRPVKATNGGKVQIARMYRLHGGTVGIDHGQGIGSIYIHMSSIKVKPGDVVKKGDTVGTVGSTGFATGPHLHWGMYVNGLPINPNQWITGVPKCG